MADAAPNDDTAPKKRGRGRPRKSVGGPNDPRPVPAVDLATRYLSGQLERDAPGQWSADRLNQSQHNDGVTYVAINALMTAIRSSTLQVLRKRKVIARDSESGTTYSKSLPSGSAGGAQSYADSKKHIPFDDEKHPLVKLLADPNGTETINELLAQLVQQIMLTGSGLMWMNVDRLSLPKELYVLPTALCQAQPPAPQYPYGYWRVTQYYPAGAYGMLPSPGYGGGVPIDARNVMRFKQPHPLWRWDALSPLTAGAVQLTILEAIDQARFSAMESGLTTDAFITSMGQSQEQMNAWMELLRQNNVGKRNHRKIMALGGEVSEKGDVKVQFPNTSPRDMDYGSGWDQMSGFALSLFGVPKAVANFTDASSYAQLYAALKQFHTLTLVPLAQWLGKWLTLHLCQKCYGPEFSIQIDVPAIDDKDMVEKKRATNLQNGLLMYNEARAQEDLPPVEGGDDVIASVFVQVQTAKAMAAAQPPAPAAAPAPGQPAPAGGDAADAPPVDAAATASAPDQGQAAGGGAGDDPDPLSSLTGGGEPSSEALPDDQGSEGDEESETQDAVTQAALAALGIGGQDAGDGANTDDDSPIPQNRIAKAYLGNGNGHTNGNGNGHYLKAITPTKPGGKPNAGAPADVAKHQEGQKFQGPSGHWFVIKNKRAVPTTAPGAEQNPPPKQSGGNQPAPADDSGNREFDPAKPEAGGLFSVSKAMNNLKQDPKKGFGGYARGQSPDEKLFDSVRQNIADHIAKGGKVTYWLDGKRVPVAKIDNNKLIDNKGQQWGMIPLAAAKPGAATGIQFHPIAPASAPTQPAAEQLPAEPAPASEKVPNAPGNFPGRGAKTRPVVPPTDYEATANQLLAGRPELKLLTPDLKVHAIKDGATLKSFLAAGGKVPEPALVAAVKASPVLTAPAAKPTLSKVDQWAAGQADKHAGAVARHFGIDRKRAHALLVSAMKQVAAHAAKTGGKPSSFTLTHKGSGKTASFAGNGKPAAPNPASQPPKPSLPPAKKSAPVSGGSGAPSIPTPKNASGAGSLPPRPNSAKATTPEPTAAPAKKNAVGRAIDHALKLLGTPAEKRLARRRIASRTLTKAHDTDHSYGCVLLPMPADITAVCLEYLAQISDEDIIEPEGESHVTALYGLFPSVSPTEVSDIIESHPSIPLTFGAFSLFTSPEHDVLKVDVESLPLRRLHGELSTLPHESKYRDYKPHLTIAYLKPGTGQKYVDAFGTFPVPHAMADTAVYSDAEGDQETFAFAGHTVSKSAMSAYSDGTGGALVAPAAQSPTPVALKRPRPALGTSGKRKRKKRHPLALAQVCKAVLDELDDLATTEQESASPELLPALTGLIEKAVSASPAAHQEGQKFQGDSGRWFIIAHGKAVPTSAPGATDGAPQPRTPAADDPASTPSPAFTPDQLQTRQTVADIGAKLRDGDPVSPQEKQQFDAGVKQLPPEDQQKVAAAVKPSSPASAPSRTEFPTPEALAAAPSVPLKKDGGVYKVTVDGKPLVVKQSARTGTSGPIEVLSSDLAKIAGVAMPAAQMTTLHGKPAVVQSWAQGDTLSHLVLDNANKAKAAMAKVPREQVDKQALFDYLLGHTDVHDGNYMVSPDGNLTAIDKEFVLGRGGLKNQRFEPPHFLGWANGDTNRMAYKFSPENVTAMADAGEKMATALEAKGMKSEARQVRDRAVVLKKFASSGDMSSANLLQLGSSGVTPPNLGLLGKLKWHLSKPT